MDAKKKRTPPRFVQLETPDIRRVENSEYEDDVAMVTDLYHGVRILFIKKVRILDKRYKIINIETNFTRHTCISWNFPE